MCDFQKMRGNLPLLLLYSSVFYSGCCHNILFLDAYQELVSEADISELVSAIDDLPQLLTPLRKMFESAATANAAFTAVSSETAMTKKFQQGDKILTPVFLPLNILPFMLGENASRLLKEMIDYSLAAHSNTYQQISEDAATYEIPTQGVVKVILFFALE